MPITNEQYLEMVARLDGNPAREPVDMPPDAVDEEIRQLHYPIIHFCKSYVHSNPCRSTTVGPGCPDFILSCNGKTFWIECKTKTGKLTPDQLAFKMLLEMQGVTMHVVRSMSEFFKAISSAESGAGNTHETST